MDNTTNGGSEQSGNPQEVTPAATNNGSDVDAVKFDFVSGLQDEGNRKLVEAKGWKTLDDGFASYSELEKKFHELSEKGVVPPSKDASEQEWDKFYAKIGRPQDEKVYEFKLPENLPEGLPYDGEMATGFKPIAHKLGLRPEQAQGVHDFYVQYAANMYGAQAKAMSELADKAHTEITKVWGEKDSPAYKQNLEYANRAIRNSGGETLLNELKEVGVLSPAGDVLRPNLARFFSSVGKELYAEETADTTNSPSKSTKDAAATLYPTDPFKTGS